MPRDLVRSRNGELANGATDGKYKKLNPTSSDPEGRNTREKLSQYKHLSYEWHGVADIVADAVVPGACDTCSCC